MNPIDQLKQKLATGKINRREFMQQTLALGVVLSAATTLSMEALAANPKQGGRFRVGSGHGSTSDSLDPGTYENGHIQLVGFAHLNHLTEIDSTGQLVPELAASYEPINGGKTWRFNIRKGVQFHDGKTLTPEDVIATLNYHRGSDSKSAAKPLLDTVTSMLRDGDTVVINLKEANADFPVIVSDYHLGILPSRGGKVNPTGGIGTGPYVINKFDPGVRAYLTRNPNYWKRSAAYFDEIELLSIIDVSARQNALITDEVDAIDRLDRKTVHLIKRNQNIKVLEITGFQHYTFPMRTDTAPFDNNHVRLALKLGIDRPQVLDKVLRGHGSVGNDHPISPANRYYASELPQRTYDPDKAKYHLKQAGLSKLSVDLSVADAAFNGAVDTGVLFKEHAAKAGIDINIVREPNDGYWNNVWMKKPWVACYWGGRATEDWMFSTAYSEGASWNDTFWKHERFNILLRLARAELDEAKRREMYVEMQRIVRDEGGVLVPFFANYIHGLSNKIGHKEKVAGNWGFDGNKATERWWFA